MTRLLMDCQSAQHDWITIARMVANGESASPRSLSTREVSPAFISFRDPTRNYIDPIGRNLNLPFAIVDFTDWMLGLNPGHSWLFNSKMEQFMNESKKYDGAYGSRFWPPQYRDTNDIGNHQVGRVIDILLRDKDSRRAVITVNNSYQENFAGKDVACTLTLQFLVRGGKLDLISSMRSEDVYLGMCYDVFCFQLLQMCVSSILDVPIGTHYHNVGSLHVYEQDIPKLDVIMDSPRFEQLPMTPPRVGAFWMLLEDLQRISDMCQMFQEGDSSIALASVDALRRIHYEYFGECLQLVVYGIFKRLKAKSHPMTYKLNSNFLWYMMRERERVK